MTELREAFEKALRQAMIGNVHVICDRLEQVDIEFAAIASELAASAALRPHLGLGVTDEQREAITAGADALSTELGHAQDNYARARMGGDPELLAEYEERCNRLGPQIALLRAIAGRGEGEGQ